MQIRARRAHAHDERGATFIIVAVSMVLLLWGGAFGVDLGLTVDGGRQTQAIADTSALDMARVIDIADWLLSSGSSTTYLNGKLPYANTDNGANATLSQTPGLWSNGTFQANGLGGKGCYFYKPPAAQPCNAVKVTATETVPQIFVGGHSSVTRTAIAAVTPEAGFSVGSYLAAFGSQQSTVLNGIFGTLGSPVNITLVGYQGLANTYVTVNQLVTASAGCGVPLTTSNVMTTSLTASQWLCVWTGAVGTQAAQIGCGTTPTPLQCNADTALGTLSFGSSTAQLCQLVSVNGSSCSNGTLSTAALATPLNVLQVLTTEAEVANGTNAIDLGVGLGITGVSDAKLTLGLISPPSVEFGPVGSVASTAQISADLQLTVAGAVLDIPLNGPTGATGTGASATATLKTLSCTNNSMTATNIQPSATAAQANMTLAGASIGTLTVQGYSGSQFGYGPSVVPPTATTAAADSNPQSAGSADGTISFTGLSTLSPVYNLLTALLPPVLGPILQASGLSVGGVEVADLSTNCGSVSLVQ